MNSVSDESKVVTVIRDGRPKNIHISFVLVGDIVILNEGMKIPADGICLDASELTTDESAMTGETGKYLQKIQNIIDYIFRYLFKIKYYLKNRSN